MEEEKKPAPEGEEEYITEERLRKAAEFVEEEEGPSRRLAGPMGTFITVVAVVMSLVHLYAAIGVIMTQILRGIHLLFVLFLTFLVFPSLKRFRHRFYGTTTSSPRWGGHHRLYLCRFRGVHLPLGDPHKLGPGLRSPPDRPGPGGHPADDQLDSAHRRRELSGLRLHRPLAAAPWTHRGYGLDRLVGHMYMTLEGIFGVPIDVSSTFIILFTIYGAFLEYSGAGKFFIDFSLCAMGGKPTGPGGP